MIEEMAQVRLITRGFAWLFTEQRLGVLLFGLPGVTFAGFAELVLELLVKGNGVSLQSLEFGLFQSLFLGAIIESSTDPVQRGGVISMFRVTLQALLFSRSLVLFCSDIPEFTDSLELVVLHDTHQRGLGQRLFFPRFLDNHQGLRLGDFIDLPHLESLFV